MRIYKGARNDHRAIYETMATKLSIRGLPTERINLVLITWTCKVHVKFV